MFARFCNGVSVCLCIKSLQTSVCRKVHKYKNWQRLFEGGIKGDTRGSSRSPKQEHDRSFQEKKVVPQTEGNCKYNERNNDNRNNDSSL